MEKRKEIRIDVDNTEVRINFDGNLFFMSKNTLSGCLCEAMLLGYDIVLNGQKYVRSV